MTRPVTPIPEVLLTAVNRDSGRASAALKTELGDAPFYSTTAEISTIVWNSKLPQRALVMSLVIDEIDDRLFR